MRSPLEGSREWLLLDEVESTQQVAVIALKDNAPSGVVFAKHQTKGTGRFGRAWFSEEGDSLTMTLILRSYPNHPKPYLLGMAVAAAAAGVVHCRLQWPNDLTIRGRKLGGILTELYPDEEARLVALVGVGINLNQKEFPADIAHRATSLHLEHGKQYDPLEVARQIVERIESLPEPNAWSDLAPVWSLYDRTPGKKYRLPDGQEATAIAVGSSGELLCSINGESHSLLAADAVFGN